MFKSNSYMKKFVSVIVAMLILASGTTSAQEWLKSPADFEALYMRVYVESGCPLDEKRLRAAIEGELVRARIKPSENWHDVYLDVSVTCMEAKVGRDLAGHFIYARYDWCTMATPVRYSEDKVFCKYSSGTKFVYPIDSFPSDIASEIARASEDSITEFIKQNM